MYMCMWMHRYVHVHVHVHVHAHVDCIVVYPRSGAVVEYWYMPMACVHNYLLTAHLRTAHLLTAHILLAYRARVCCVGA